MGGKQLDIEEILLDKPAGKSLNLEIRKEVSSLIAVPITKKVDSCENEFDVKEEEGESDCPAPVPITFEVIKVEPDENEDQFAPKKKDEDLSSRDDNGNDHSIEVDHEMEEDFGDKSANEEEDCYKSKKLLGKSSRSEKDIQCNSIMEKKYKCDICPEEFSTRNHLSTHEKTHTLIKPFKCDVCGVVVTTAKTLRTHLMIHTGNYKFKCDVCNKGYCSALALKRHKVFHSGNYEFKCEICNKEFSQKETLRTHTLVHKSFSEYPIYKCHLCCFSTVHKSSVRVHLKNVHVPRTEWSFEGDARFPDDK